ncbi:hypothetical protein ACI2KR_07975 [Pseudomonas luteola]
MDLISVIGKKGEYAGVGTRNINKDASFFFMCFGACAAFSGLKVNSGSADGSDTSFEFGAKIAYDAMCEMDSRLVPRNYGAVMNMFLPWKGFNGRENIGNTGYIDRVNPRAHEIAATFHSNWARLDDSVRKLMSRNVMQILNEQLNRTVRFVMCETPDGAVTAKQTSPKTGGTGQAIRIADHYKVPVYNMKNASHLLKAEEWVNSTDTKIMSMYGVSPIQLVKEYMGKYKGIRKSIEGDLVEMALDGEFDVIVQGCNCFNTMGSGIAKSIRSAFPEAYAVDQNTKAGDKRKLGSYTSVTVDRNEKQITIINAYTQYKYGRDQQELYADYKKIREVFNRLAGDFNGKRIGIPRIGSGLANGCWATISNIIQSEMKGQDLTLVDLPVDRGLEHRQENKSFKRQNEQMGLGF